MYMPAFGLKNQIILHSKGANAVRLETYNNVFDEFLIIQDSVCDPG